MRPKSQKGLDQVLETVRVEKRGVVKKIPISVNVHGVRRKTGLTQEQFSETYMIPLATLQNWEQGHRGKRKPTLTAILLLKLIEADPEGMAEQMTKLRKEEK
ncbi:MAG: helix-turn-helix domain-containing protein [Patescibacteria group bacterium]